MILLRHGQSLFNLHFTATRRDPGIRDAPLTPLGHEQAELAAKALAILEERKITSLVVVDAEQRVEGVVHLHDLWGVELI